MVKSKSKSVKNSNLRNITISALIFIILISVILLSTGWFSAKNPDMTVVEINNISLPVKHFQSEIQRIVPEVYTYFKIKHNIVADDEESFWSGSFGGEKPAEVARQKVLQKWTENIVVLELAKEKGLIEDITYHGLIKWWKDENKARKQKVEKGEIVYGPYEYSWEGFIDTNISTFRSKLERIFSEHEFKLSDGELISKYETDKNEKYINDDDVTIKQIKLPYYDKNPNVINGLMKDAEEKIKKARERIDTGESFETVASSYNKDGAQMEMRYKPENAYEDSKTDSILRRTALQLQQGEISGIIHDKSRQFFAIIQCVERKPGGFMPFEEKIAAIQLAYSRDQLDRMIAQKTNEAKIVTNDKVYSKILP